ncbi:MAG TPA: hypothetical protein VGO11_10695 [Chthoniobacteraceae bacterium]|jgi:hypothetical protein|nr:hypothetical protein [Chthoniobacteraceae bacterium]
MKLLSSLEALESRIAPSTLQMMNPTTATYTDGDGDLVKVKFSKGILSAANLAGVLVTTAVDPTHDQLQKIDLTVAGLVVPAGGTSITVTVTPKLPGDGFANIGYINATGLDLGAVTIRGDLGAIDAGDATTKTPGLKGLTVQSYGVLGLTTGAPDLESDIVGALSKLTVKEDMKGARLEVSGGKDGKLPSVTITGSLIGASLDRSGAIHTTGDLGTVKIGVDLRGGSVDLMGNKAHGAGGLISDGKIGSVTIGVQMLGGGTSGAGEGAGIIKSAGDMGAISIGTNLFGGIGDSSGSIISGGKLASVKIGGTLQGGIVKIGAGTPRNGYIGSAGDMGKITILGNLSGTFIPYAGTIESGGKIAAVAISGDMIGGDDHSGSILSAKTIGSVKIGGSVSGGNGDSSGSIITSGGDLPSITTGGGVFGGQANKSGIISGKKLGTIKIGGQLFGGNSFGMFSFSDSGEVLGTSIASLTIGGAFTGGSAGNQTLARVGFISATTITSLTINGDMFGGSISGTGSVTDSASISADHIGKVVINGSISSGGIGSGSNGGTVTRSGAIVATHDITSIKVKGDIDGAADVGKGIAPILISAVGQLKPTAKADLAIGSLTVGGHVSLLNVLAGFTPALTAVNGGAQIGAVTVTGSWSQSNLVAGAMNATSTNKNFGNANDAAIPTGSAASIAKIASIKIGGVISGSPAATSATDHFGFVAHAIGGFFIGGTKITLPAGPVIQDIGATGDVSLHLI